MSTKRTILVAKNCGFCVGVRQAVSIVEKTLRDSGDRLVFSLGMFIHNELEIERLKAKGLKIADNIEQVPEGSLLLLPSHGSLPEVLEVCDKKSIDTVDLICVYVKKLQQIVRLLSQEGFDIVMLGDKKHPEVRAVSALTDALIVVDKQDVLNDNLNLNLRQYGVVSQTTQSLQVYKKLLLKLLDGSMPEKEVRIYNTICWDVVKRQKEAEDLAKVSDLVFVLGGRKSANTYRLFEIAQQYTQAYLISDLGDYSHKMLKGRQRIAIISGTSTPDWFVEEFRRKIELER